MAFHRVFQISHGDKKIIFVPDLQKLFLVSMSETIPDLIKSGEESKVAVPQPDFKFRAAHLIINNICNLRCIYCYANAGLRNPQIIPLEVAIAAINKVADDTKEMGYPIFEVGLIGGEPTLSMEVVREVVKNTREIAGRKRLNVRIGIVSNGVFGEDIRRYLIDHLDYITFSLDGHREIHDKHRPRHNNKGSFDVVFKNAKSMYDAEMTVGIRCTVSSISVTHLSEIITFLYENFPKAMIGVEPLQECGRCLITGTLSPDPMIYAKHLIAVLRTVKERNIRIKTSILRFKCQGGQVSFCGVNGQNFAINPEGFVTGCTRVTSSQDHMAPTFYYGRYDKKKRGFVFDYKRYKWLKTLVVDNIPECNDCFARFNCRGDCPIVKSDYNSSFAQSPSQRCEAIREITLGLFKIQLGLI